MQLFLPEQTLFLDKIGLEYPGIRLVSGSPRFIGRVAGRPACIRGYAHGWKTSVEEQVMPEVVPVLADIVDIPISVKIVGNLIIAAVIAAYPLD